MQSWTETRVCHTINKQRRITINTNKIGIAVAGLSLLFASASAKANETLTRTWRITVGGAVTTLQLPIAPEQGWSSFVFKANSVRARDTGVLLRGKAVVYHGESLSIAADQITVKLQGKQDKKVLRSFSLKGHAVLTLFQNKQQVMRITADNAVLEPQLKSP